jgi:uncharacterized membrane protein YtjA (UPF0391 family)
MAEREGIGVNLIWAITLLISVALVAGAIYYTGMIGNAGGDKKIDVEVKVPDAPVKTN